MKRATFQIEPTAQFNAGRPNSKLNALAERLFGRTRVGSADLGMPIRARSEEVRYPVPSGVSLRKRSPQEALNIQGTRPAPQSSQLRKPPRVEPPAGLHRVAQAFPQRTADPICEYRGYVISTVQGPDGRWSASYVQQADGQGGIGVVPLPRRYATTYLARFLAIADAELEIDELVELRG